MLDGTFLLLSKNLFQGSKTLSFMTLGQTCVSVAAYLELPLCDYLASEHVCRRQTNMTLASASNK